MNYDKMQNIFSYNTIKCKVCRVIIRYVVAEKANRGRLGGKMKGENSEFGVRN